MISELFAKYQSGATHTADITYGKVTNRALGSAEFEIFCRLHHPPSIVARSFRRRTLRT